MVVAKATGMQVANAQIALATLERMAAPMDAEWRRQRLTDLWRQPDFGSKAALARALEMGTDGSYIGQMERGERAITEKFIDKVAALRGGKFRHWFDIQHAAEGIPAYSARQAHLMSHPGHDAPALTWEQLMQAEKLPSLFRVSLVDNALADELHAGDEVVIDTTANAAAGDFVVVRDRDGQLYVRMYRERRAGEWSAHAMNPAFEPMESVRDGLTVVGVVVEERRKRRRSEL